MTLKKLKRVIGNGLLLAIPLGTILYIFIKLIGMLAKVIAPIATNLGIRKILGELTLTILSVFVLLIIIVLLGLLMRNASVAKFSKNVEDVAFKIFPSLNQVKILAGEKLDFDNQSANWKPVLAYYEEKYNPAYIVEEDDQLAALFIIKGTGLADGEILIAAKADMRIIHIQPFQLTQGCRQYGKGFLEIIQHAEHPNT